MSPSAALADPVFRAYVGIMLGVLVGAGAILALLQFVFRIELGNVWKTYHSWLWMAPLVAVADFRRARSVHHRGNGARVLCIQGICACLRVGSRPLDDRDGFRRDCRSWSRGLGFGNWLIFVALAPVALILVLPDSAESCRAARCKGCR